MTKQDRPGKKTRFTKGKSGNPSGRKKIPPEVKALAKEHGPKAFEVIIKLMKSKNEHVRMAAAKEVYDRAYGKTPLPLVGADGGPIEIEDVTDLDLARSIAFLLTKASRGTPDQ